MKKIMSVLAVLGIALTSCQPQARVEEKPEQLTLGTVQKRIEVGMAQAEVAEALGMPNIATRDSRGKESWIYDKMASEVNFSHESGGVWLILAGAGKNSSTVRSSQRTLTVVIKFSDSGKVDDVTYHSTQF